MTERNRDVPRPFNFRGGGRGDIIEEAAVDHYEGWAPAIQVLRFESGEIGLRFCYYVRSGQIANRALWLNEENIADLRREIASRPQVRRLLQQLL